MRSEERIIATPVGEGRLVTRRAPRPIATVLLSHGAGGGIDARDLTALATHLPRQGVNVMLFEQPWRTAGRKVATPPATLDVGLRAAVDAVRVRTPIILGGRSAGARSACRSARELGASGCLALSFPLHPPGKPEKSRLDELAGADVPTLVIQGGNDPFGRPEEFPDPLPNRTDLAVVPDGDHSLAVPKRASITQDDAMEIVVEAALEWIVREIVGNGATR
ncbi:alpha/beta hydrolase family protein [Nocardioides antri]|uniref:Hydrolase n=1 Tax=Nocardioides antri TaxID=2607659 RepID=A0A5B1M9Z1_9ACTN|nr:alpha/beta family hydrolase [Nocardioides antri]KAA1428809.1 hydrolase [Nocardioides antri]